MSDRPTVPPRGGSSPAASPAPTGGDAPRTEVRDAIYEDIAFAGPAGDAVPVERPALSPTPAFEEVDLSPSADGPEAFQIDFDGRSTFAEVPSTALAPIARPLPATAPGRGGPPAPPAPPPPPVAPRAEARRLVRDKLRMLRRYRALILGTTLLGLALAGLYSALVGPSYTAYSVLLVNPNLAEGTSRPDGRFVDAPGGGDSKVLNQAIVLQQDPEIAGRTAAAVLARPDAEVLSTVREAAAEYGTPVTPESLADFFQEEVVDVRRAGDEVDAIQLEATAEDPEEAALIARLYTAEYIALSRASNRERVGETRAILEEQIARRQGELSEIESQLAGYMTSQNAAGLDEQTRVTVSQVGQLQSQLDNARVEAQTYAAQLRQLEDDLASVPRRLDSSSLAPSPVETAQLDADIARLETLVENIYTQNPQFRGNPQAHPDLARLTDRLQGLKADRLRLAGSATDAAVAAGGLNIASTGSNGSAYVADLQRQISQTRAALQGARARAAALESRLGAARGQLRAVPGQQVALDQLERQREATAATLRQLQQEYDTAQLAESTELGFAQVVRDVQTPRKPTSPDVPLNLLFGGLFGLFGGLAIALFRDQTDGVAHAAEDLADHGFTVVGTIPDVSAALRGGRQEIEGASVDPGLVTVTRPFAPEAEAFRHLHAGLAAGGAAGAQVVLVTSPDGGAGTSLVAANLAAAAAQAGRSVLLVDADLRQPSVAERFGLGAHPPLGEGPEGTNFLYWSTAVPGLFAMTPRDAAASPDQQWAPHQVGTLLQHLRTAFDLVVTDAPSAVGSADAAHLAPYADAALLVAQADRTDLDALTRVATDLTGAGLHRIGAVLNRTAPVAVRSAA